MDCRGMGTSCPFLPLMLCSLPTGTAPNPAPASRGQQPPTSTTRSCCSTSRRSKTSTWKRGTSELGEQSSWTGEWSSEHPCCSCGCAWLLGQGTRGQGHRLLATGGCGGFKGRGRWASTRRGAGFSPHCVCGWWGTPRLCPASPMGDGRNMGKGCRRRGLGESTSSSCSRARKLPFALLMPSP